MVVWYNPRCSKCRGAEQLLADYGVPAQRVFYLDNPPPWAEITRVLALLGTADPRTLMRTAEPRYTELGLGDASPDELIEAMTRYPSSSSARSSSGRTGRSSRGRRNCSCRCWKPGLNR